jgi:hypothetical protein
MLLLYVVTGETYCSACVSFSVISTNFAIFGAKFAKFSTTQKLYGKKKNIVHHTTPLWIDIRRLVQIVEQIGFTPYTSNTNFCK